MLSSLEGMRKMKLVTERTLFSVVPQNGFAFPHEWTDTLRDTVFSSERAAVEGIKLLMGKSYFWAYAVIPIRQIGIRDVDKVST